jgi:hypothetical protein
MPTTEEYLHQSSSAWGDALIEALREGMANPEFLEFGVIAEGLVINVPSVTWLFPHQPICFS